MDELMELQKKQFVKMAEGKTLAEVRQLFGIESDFGPGDLAEIESEYEAWKNGGTDVYMI